ncbi:Laminin subunit alpha-2 [Colletotrichum sp. SAR11_59]|nr:Laminin subunit alpha-2 [Colletotrichum sp. SAR11_59]
MLGSGDSTIETRTDQISKLTKNVSDLEDSLRQKDSLIADAKAETTQAMNDRLYYHNCLIRVTASEALHKECVDNLEKQVAGLEEARDGYKAEVAQLRQDLEMEKQIHDREMQDLEKSHHREKELYKAQLTTARMSVRTLKTEHAKAIKDAQAEHQRQLTSQTETHQAVVGEFEREIIRLRSEGQTLVGGKTAIENTLGKEKRETALKASRIMDLENALEEEKRQTALKASRITTLESQLTEATLGDTENGNRLRQVEGDLEAANNSHAHALEQWTRLFFGPVAVYGEDTFKTAIAGGTHAATQDHRPWVVGEFWNVSQQECEFSGHSISTIVPMLVQVLEEEGFEVSRFHGMMRQLTKLVSRAPQVNTALLAWVIQCCNQVISARQEDLIPSQAAVWALADVLVSRWPDTGLVGYRSSDVVRECWDLIQQPDAHEGDSPLLKIQHGDNDLCLIRKQGWYWAVLMDMQERICYFLKPECMVPIGRLGLYLHLKAGTIDVQLKLDLDEVWNFYVKFWQLKN